MNYSPKHVSVVFNHWLFFMEVTFEQEMSAG